MSPESARASTLESLYLDDVIAHVVREFGTLRVETVDWPIILLEFPERRFGDAEFADALDYIERLLREGHLLGEKSFQVTDLTRMQEIAPASQRKYVSEWAKRTLDLQKVASVGAANVTPSSILRGLVTAVHLFQPPPTPTTFVSTRKEAWVVALKALDEARAPLSPVVRARLSAR